ncbi:flagellar basal-body rod protein FlgF [Desulfocurvus sp. DL9XJH121]
MYSAMFGALTQEHRMDIIANNLANVNTTGYKRDRQAFKDVFVSYAHDTIREPMMNMRSEALFPPPDYYAKPRIAVSKTEFTQGALKQTGNDLDVALSGEGFFKVRAQNGEDYYTRDGAFSLTSEGQLINGRGDSVLGGGDVVEIPPGSKVFIDDQGRIIANGEEIAVLDMVDVADTMELEKVGANYFKLMDGAQGGEVPVPEGTVVAQGYLEQPNVEVVTEMVNMIETQRAFEAYQRVITTTGETDSKAILKVGSDK